MRLLGSEPDRRNSRLLFMAGPTFVMVGSLLRPGLRTGSSLARFEMETDLDSRMVKPPGRNVMDPGDSEGVGRFRGR